MSPIDPSLRVAAVHLAVSNLSASVTFYSRVIGMELLEDDGSRALLGAGGRPALELSAIEHPHHAAHGSTGLFHVAWLHPSRAALAATVRRIAAAGWPFTGASDHAVSEALYLDDPDGLGVEVYADRPRETWQPGPGGEGVRMVTLPLDVEDLVAQAPGPPGAAIDAGTGIGHVHLKVAEVSRAEAFYLGLGFERQAGMPSAAFVSAGGYHHHVGLNSWQSAGGRPPAADAPGLRRVSFELDAVGLDALAAVAPTAQRDGGGVELNDPDRHALEFRAR